MGGRVGGGSSNRKNFPRSLKHKMAGEFEEPARNARVAAARTTVRATVTSFGFHPWRA
jgi:hypothetical protein